MKIMCNEKPQGRPAKKEIKELKDNLTAFYKTDFEPLIQKDTLEYTHMNTILDYLTIDILTMYENNIKNHFVEYMSINTQEHHYIPCNELTPWLVLGTNADGWSHVWDCSWILNNEQSWKIGIRLNLTTPN